MECLGGNGYVEEAPLARLYREVPVNSIWEGSGNVMALDVARVLQREPAAVQMVMDELLVAAGDDQHLRRAHARLEAMLQEPKLLDARGRTLVEALAVLAAGTILRAHAPAGGGRCVHRHAHFRRSAADVRAGTRARRRRRHHRPRLTQPRVSE